MPPGNPCKRLISSVGRAPYSELHDSEIGGVLASDDLAPQARPQIAELLCLRAGPRFVLQLDRCHKCPAQAEIVDSSGMFLENPCVAGIAGM